MNKSNRPVQGLAEISLRVHDLDAMRGFIEYKSYDESIRWREIMQPISAFSLAPDACDWLANSRQARILHVFDRSCNLINERREVLSIVTQRIRTGPFNFVIEDNILFSHHRHADSPILICENQLNLRDLNINTAKPNLWSPPATIPARHSNHPGHYGNVSPSYHVNTANQET